MKLWRKVKLYLRRVKEFVRSGQSRPVSSDYSFLASEEVPDLNGWKAPATALEQHEAFVPLINEVYAEKPRIDFQVAAQAVHLTGIEYPSVVEVGCGSGYYSELLPLLLHKPVNYFGVDYAYQMVQLATRLYPDPHFVTGDACFLPLASGSCDVLISGTSLMHIANYRKAIAESSRVSREWCLFHTVPVMTGRPTTFFKKRAYGEMVLEIVFNKHDLEQLLSENNLGIEAIFESIPYNVESLIGEKTWTVSYLCRKRVR